MLIIGTLKKVCLILGTPQTLNPKPYISHIETLSSIEGRCCKLGTCTPFTLGDALETGLLLRNLISVSIMAIGVRAQVATVGKPYWLIHIYIYCMRIPTTLT